MSTFPISDAQGEKQGHFCPCLLWSLNPFTSSHCTRTGVYLWVKNGEFLIFSYFNPKRAQYSHHFLPSHQTPEWKGEKPTKKSRFKGKQAKRKFACNIKGGVDQQLGYAKIFLSRHKMQQLALGNEASIGFLIVSQYMIKIFLQIFAWKHNVKYSSLPRLVLQEEDQYFFSQLS
jgi:hypothetical protein